MTVRAPIEPKPYTCVQCGAGFTSKGPRPKYCSSKCCEKARPHRKNKPLTEEQKAARRAPPRYLTPWQEELPSYLPVHFKDAVEPGDGGCWLWKKSINKHGYGWASLNGKTHEAHRAAYILKNGIPPRGLVLDHICRVRRCINPEHLEPVTPKENLVRGNTTAGALLCPNGHEFSRLERQRRCLTCLAEYQARRRKPDVPNGDQLPKHNLSVFVAGTPAAKGSKRFVGVAKNGRGIMIESSKKVEPWRNDVRAAVSSNGLPLRRFPGAVSINCEFVLDRPKRLGEHKNEPHMSKPDLDKMLRSTFDSLTSAGVWRDDAQVTEVTASKRYAELGEPTGCFLRITDPFPEFTKKPSKGKPNGKQKAAQSGSDGRGSRKRAGSPARKRAPTGTGTGAEYFA